jgi:aminoglycoside 6'-N-acetyltransferase I
MRLALWPECSTEELQAEMELMRSGSSTRTAWSAFLAEDGDGRALGMVELSERSSAFGCESDRVAYLEAWYVVPHARKQGVGRALVAWGAEWGRARGCVEYASDAETDNDVSIAAHQALGFEDVGLARCFRKDLP